MCAFVCISNRKKKEKEERTGAAFETYLINFFRCHILHSLSFLNESSLLQHKMFKGTYVVAYALSIHFTAGFFLFFFVVVVLFFIFFSFLTCISSFTSISVARTFFMQ